MAEELRVEGKVEKGVILLTVLFSEELLLQTGASNRLSKELTERYQEIRDKEKARVEITSCVVEIRSETAGSPLVRALFELWALSRNLAGGPFHAAFLKTTNSVLVTAMR